MLNDKILKVERLFASYFKREVLHGVSLEAEEKEIVGLIGPNGAGKSTLLKAIFGIIQTKKGSVKGKIVFNGNDITKLSPREKVEAGIGYLLQGGEIFSNLAVEDNLILGRQNKEANGRKDYVYSLFPKLASLRKKRAGLLSGGERQMLAIGIILMSKPKLLLLDEPTAGLSQDIADTITGAILKIREKSDTSILLVEQNVERCLKVSDRIYLMRNGEIIDKGSPAVMAENQKVEKLFYY